jgi:diguanylate cyclase (GGDEF)-like protein
MDKEIESLLGNARLFEKMSDIIRLVDPVHKKIIRYKNKKASTSDISCFDFWGKNAVCDNCVSMRAFNENLTYVKIEYTSEKIFMITAVPYDLEDRRIVVEILKEMTNSIILGSTIISKNDNTDIHTLIDSFNNMAYRDPLTGLFNRRYIGEKLPVDLLNAALSSQPLSIIMIDLDHFKNVNDSFGHQGGDAVLKSFSKTITGCLKRSSDWAARYGGEEFLVCLPGADLDTAVAAAELMRQSAEGSVTPYDGCEIQLTASFGVACVSPTSSSTPDDLIKSADALLYAAKENGRNRVEFSGS